jgi:hypothetical protein
MGEKTGRETPDIYTDSNLMVFKKCKKFVERPRAGSL